MQTLVYKSAHGRYNVKKMTSKILNDDSAVYVSDKGATLMCTSTTQITNHNNHLPITRHPSRICTLRLCAWTMSTLEAIHTEAFGSAGPAPVFFHGRITREQAEERLKGQKETQNRGKPTPSPACAPEHSPCSSPAMRLSGSDAEGGERAAETIYPAWTGAFCALVRPHYTAVCRRSAACEM